MLIYSFPFQKYRLPWKCSCCQNCIQSRVICPVMAITTCSGYMHYMNPVFLKIQNIRKRKTQGVYTLGVCPNLDLLILVQGHCGRRAHGTVHVVWTLISCSNSFGRILRGFYRRDSRKFRNSFDDWKALTIVFFELTENVFGINFLTFIPYRKS